jgi:RND family efflux transporter MFP subunit
VRLLSSACVWILALWSISPAAAASSAVYPVRALTEPVADVVLSARVPGQVSRIHFGEGDFVKSGAVLLEFEQKTELLEVQRKQVQLETLQSELDRSELLFKTSSSMPREELDRKRGEVAVARVELDQAKEMVVHRQVVAPFDGIITLLPVKVGEYCDLARPVLRLVDSREFHAVSNADPARAGHVRVGEKLAIEMSTPGGPVMLDGTVVFVSPVVDPASGLMRLKVKFANPDNRVRPGVAGMLQVPAPNAP